MVAAIKEIDEPTTKILKEIVKSLFELARVRAKEEVSENLAHRRTRKSRYTRKQKALKQEDHKPQEEQDVPEDHKPQEEQDTQEDCRPQEEQDAQDAIEAPE